MNCEHYWIPAYKEDGMKNFVMHNGVESVHATCSKCNIRTWFTREQWFAMPATELEI